MTEETQKSTVRNWDPEPGQRVYVQSSRSGEQGWIVKRDGVDKVRLNRPNQEILLPFGGEWTQLVEHRRASHAQLVQVAYEADRALLRLLGEYQKAKVEFRDLKEKAVVAWLEDGPTEPPIRQLLYRTVLDLLSEHMVG